MKDRILCVAIALSMIAVMFVVAPSSTEAAVDYTGSIETTDEEGDSVNTYYRGEDVYVLVETFYRGNASNESFHVGLWTQSGEERYWFEADTGDPETGVYESWAATPTPLSLWTGYGFEGELIVYDVVLEVWNGIAYIEVDRTQIVVKNAGLFLDPDTGFYYPEQTVILKIVSTNPEDFYVQVVNDTWVDIMNETDLSVYEEDDWTLYITWEIAPDTPDGEYTINVRDENSHAMWPISMYSKEITISKYVLTVDSEVTYVLPGQTVSMVYDVVDIATLTHHTGVTIEYTAIWTDVDDDEVVDTGELEGSSGTFEFTVDVDIAAYSDINIMFWANESDDRSAEDSVFLTVGALLVDLDLDGSTYTPGDTVGVDVTVTLDQEWDFWGPEALPGAEVDIVVLKNGTEMQEYGASGLVTDVTGVIEHEFTLDDDADKGTYVVDIVLTFLDFEVTRMATFNVEWSGFLVVEFSKDYYYSGQTAAMDFKVVWNNVEVNATQVYYELSSDFGLLATGNSSIGMAEFPIPDDYVGDIRVEAFTTISGYYFGDVDTAEVRLADLALYPVAEEYRAGDTVTWIYEITTVISNGTISYVVVDEDGLRVASGEMTAFVKSGSFDFVVPEEDPSDHYTATLTLNDELGHIVSDDSTVGLLAEYELRIWLDSGAGYTSDAFEPGATIAFGYSIEAIGVADLDIYRISFYATDGFIHGIVGNVLVAENSGTFEYTLHENVNNGEYWMVAGLQDPVTEEWLSSHSAMFMVEGDQSLWDKSVGGLSVFETTVLLLLLIMVILLVLVPMIRARMEAKPKKETPVPKSMELEPPEPPEAGPEEPKS